MALGDTYATLDELKAYLNLTGQASTDDQLQDALQSASAEIERHTNRQFNKATSATARVYVPRSRDRVWIDDFYTSASLVVETDDSGLGTYATVWASTDYELRPFNGIVDGQAGWPYYRVGAVGTKWFPNWAGLGPTANVRVTAMWGWSAVPAPVKQSCLILAAETFQLKNAPLGVAGMGEFGVVRVRNNQMARDKLSKYTRSKILVG